jgi:hypothetical protein
MILQGRAQAEESFAVFTFAQLFDIVQKRVSDRAVENNLPHPIRTVQPIGAKCS